MTDYVVTHLWPDTDAGGDLKLRIVPGSVDHPDIAFYVADLLAEYVAGVLTGYTGQLAWVYELDPEIGLVKVDPRPEPTMNPDDIPRMRVEPSSDEGAPPDILSAPDPSGGGLGLLSGTGALLTGPTGTETETTDSQILTSEPAADPVNHKGE